MTQEVLKNRQGMIIGKIKRGNGSKLWIYGKNEIRLGCYDPQSNKTHDKNDVLVGTGNLLTSLLSLR